MGENRNRETTAEQTKVERIINDYANFGMEEIRELLRKGQYTSLRKIIEELNDADIADYMEEMEEERRLCYVALTRAKERLYLTCAGQRMLFGRTSNNRPSRFAGEIPAELLEQSGRSYLDPSPAGDDYDFDQTPQVSTCRDPYRPAYGGGERRSAYTPGRPQKSSSRPVFQSSVLSAPSAALPEYQQGDMLEHKAFGHGMVLSAQKSGGDVLLEIAFDGVGTKRLLLKYTAHLMKKL